MLDPKVDLEVSVSGETLYFRDITGTTSSTAYSQSGNIAYSDITSVRIKNASYETLTDIQTLISGEFTQYVEYINVGIDVTIDNKTFTAGEYFVPQVSGIAVSGTWQTTGFYVYPFSWTPSIDETPLEISTAQLNESASTKVEDNVRLLEYEVYYPQSTPTVAAVDGNTYLVTGTGTIIYNGNTYRSREVFTANDTSNITRTGSAVVNVLYASVSQYYTTLYNVYQGLYASVVTQFGKKWTDINQLVMIRTQLEALNNMSATNNVSITKSKEMLDFLTDEVAQLP